MTKQAKQAASSVKKGAHTAAKSKVWTKTTFRLPKTLALDRKPKFATRAVTKLNTFDRFAIIKHPLSTESAMKTIEDNNTLVFIVNRKATKTQIRKALLDLYQLKVKKVNTLIRPDGYKKAYAVLPAETEALQVPTESE